MDETGYCRRGPEGLVAKYETILALRRSALEMPEAGPPKAQLQALSRRYPGALRELDQRTMPDLERRIRQLRAANTAARPLPDWAQAQILYHGFLHAALRLRPVLRASGCDRAAVLRDYLPEGDEPPASALCAKWLAAIAWPAGGRLNPVAFAFAAAQLGLVPEQIERLVFF